MCIRDSPQHGEVRSGGFYGGPVHDTLIAGNVHSGPGGDAGGVILVKRLPAGQGLSLIHIYLTACRGQIIGVTGPVACGKSTLGKAFLCEQPYGGSIRLDGRELAELSPDVYKRPLYNSGRPTHCQDKNCE